MNCSVPPTEILAELGVTLIEVTISAVTLSVAGLLVMPLSAAVIVVEPPATPVARPLESIVAIDGTDEDQVTEEVTLAVEPSL